MDLGLFQQDFSTEFLCTPHNSHWMKQVFLSLKLKARFLHNVLREQRDIKRKGTQAGEKERDTNPRVVSTSLAKYSLCSGTLKPRRSIEAKEARRVINIRFLTLETFCRLGGNSRDS